MIPDYLTFIRFQDKRSLIYIYAIGLILIGFYWKMQDLLFHQRILVSLVGFWPWCCIFYF
ncbi:inner membrane protein [Escherichia coli]|nr:inner membrane protein [Escherichia coli]